MNAFLTGEKIYLRPVELSDATGEYLAWLNDEETTKGLATGTFPSSMEALQKFVLSCVDNKNVVFFAICDKETDAHIGNIKLDTFDWVARTCELGLLIGNKNYRGKGIGSEVCKLVLNYAFDELNIRKILLAVYANNPVAIKLYERLGFVTEGRLRRHIFEGGEFHDKLLMGIFKEEVK